MKIEAGKFYTTRAGRKARIYVTDAGGTYPVHGAILLEDSTWYVECWTERGEVLVGPHDADIVYEWRAQATQPVESGAMDGKEEIEPSPEILASLDKVVSQLATQPAQQAPAVSDLMVDTTPPATARDRWMYEQGRLAERDPRSHSAAAPIDMILHCPKCGKQHIDAPEGPLVVDGRAVTPTLWHNPPHRSHLCHGCGHIWRPADVPTNGVATIKTKGKNDSPVSEQTVPSNQSQGGDKP